MTTLRLLFRNVLYHWRGNLAVLLGMALGTAVLTGALLVGDSLRGSLRGLALEQLGWVDHALISNRFFDADLAERVDARRKASVLMLQGSVRADREGESARHVAGVSVYGVTDAFWASSAGRGGADAAFFDGAEPGIVLNQALARALDAKVGERVEILLPRKEDLPRESLLGKKQTEDVVQSIRVPVQAILDDAGPANFSLRPSPVPPRNAFLPLGYLAKELGMAGKANVVLAAGPRTDRAPGLRLADWGYALTTPAERAKDLRAFYMERPRAERLPKETIEKLVSGYPDEHPYLNFQGQRGVIEPAVADAVRQAAEGEKAKSAPVLVYLADDLKAGDAEIPYAVVAAVPGVPDPARPGRLLPIGADEAYLAQWETSGSFPADAKSLSITYLTPDAANNLEKRTATFAVKGRVPLSGRLDDPFWTPPFPGITDKLSINDWVPFSFIDLKRVRKIDDEACKIDKTRPLEDYWRRYKTTPRAFVALAKGQELWGSRYGKLSSIQITPARGDDWSKAARRLEEEVLSRLPPAAGGFVFQDVKTQALQAGGGSSDFGVYFLAFSFFLIVAALLLVGLLVRLNLERRAAEMGLLLAVGWSQRKIRALLIGEGTLLALVGGLIGLSAAFAYTGLLLGYLKANWPGGADLGFLKLHAGPASLLLGFGASVAASLVTLYWATRVLGKMAPTTLLAGAAALAQPQAGAGWRWSAWIAPVSFVGAAAAFAAGWFVQDHEARAGTFFTCGALILIGGIAFLWRRLGHAATHSAPQPTLTLLGVRNAGRYRLRSVLTIGLLASATFVIVAIDLFHKETGETFLRRDQGSGGFALVAQSDVPIFEDLNRKSTRTQLDLRPGEAALLERATFYPMRMRAGDDASCLNLYQPLKPRILGASKAFRERGGFAFGSTLAKTDEEKANPWRLLEGKSDEGIPVLADANTATWILQVGLGDTLEVPGDGGSAVRLRVVGLLQDSLFQSELVMAEENFVKAFPHQEGFNFFLIECPPEEATALERAVQNALASQGFRMQSTRERVQAYFAVENVYLATFQALGGLGLLLGALGLAIVLLRGVWERRGQLALGAFRRRRGLAVPVENGPPAASAWRLAWPRAPGGGHLMQQGAACSGWRVALLLAVVAAVGLMAGTLAVAASLRTPILTALRRE
ncbi:MAG: ABC transporter permease [Gemmataceae bacterium]